MARILVVDDEKLVRVTLADMLAEDHHEVLTAVNSVDGMMKLIEPDHVSLIITDVRMPGEQNGIDFAIAAKALHNGLPVVILTGYHEESSEKLAQLEEPFLFFKKPYRTSQILEAVEQFLRASIETQIEHGPS